MSTCYWMIEGIGILTNRLIPFLDKVKYTELIKKEFSFSLTEEQLLEDLDYVAEALCKCDDTQTLAHSFNEDGENFLFYPKSFSWERRKKEPDCIADVHKNIIDAVLCLCNMTREQVEEMIDDSIYEVGCG